MTEAADNMRAWHYPTEAKPNVENLTPEQIAEIVKLTAIWAIFEDRYKSPASDKRTLHQFLTDEGVDMEYPEEVLGMAYGYLVDTNCEVSVNIPKEDIVDRIYDHVDSIEDKRASETDRQHNEFQKRLADLEPMFEALKPISEMGFDILYNLDKGHLPCPAIQTSISRANQIWLYKGKWSIDGSINRRQKGITFDEVIKVVINAAAEHLANRWKQGNIRYGNIIEGDNIIGRDRNA